MESSLNTTKKRIRWGKTISIYLLMLPALIYLFINNIMPMAGVIIAFKRINLKEGIFGSPWNGLQNFSYLFSSGDAWMITRNTVLYNVVFIVLGMVLGVAIAILLNEIRGRFTSRLYQTLILLPYLISWVIVSYLVYSLINAGTGYIPKTVLPALGIHFTEDIYQTPNVWPFILIFANLWKGIGFSCILYLSGIVGIGQEYFEAAMVDGATKWQQIKSITLPCLKPTMIMMFILSLGRMFYSDFGLFYQVPKNSGMLYSVTQTIDTYVYNALMTQNNMGMSSAAGFYQSAVGLVLIIGANFLIRAIDPENALI